MSAASYMIWERYGSYKSQKIVFSKLYEQKINSKMQKQFVFASFLIC